MTRVYVIESEWDFGHEYEAFATKVAASQWLQKQPGFIEMAEADGQTVSEFYAEVAGNNLVSFKRLGMNYQDD